MTTSGTGVFFDGRTSRREDVHVALEGALVLIRPDGGRLEIWPYFELRELSAPRGVLRITREGGPPLARLEIRDEALAGAVRDAAPSLEESREEETGTARKAVFWSLAAVVSLTLFGLFGIPALADRVTPLLPWSVDQRMGQAGDQQLRLIFSSEDGDFECGKDSEERPGRVALDRLAKKLSDAAALPVPIEIVAVRNEFVNALALPGGPIYLFDGLIERAKSGDEIAGVLAHEIGHVAHRDGTRRALQGGGVSLLFGFILGDFVGATAAVTIVRVLSEASYSRAAESDADAYSVGLLKSLGGDPKAVGGFLTRMSDDEPDPKDVKSPEAEPKPEPDASRPKARDLIGGWIASHPETGQRRRAIEALAGDGPAAPLVDDADFLAIKRICGPKR